MYVSSIDKFQFSLQQFSFITSKFITLILINFACICHLLNSKRKFPLHSLFVLLCHCANVIFNSKLNIFYTKTGLMKKLNTNLYIDHHRHNCYYAATNPICNLVQVFLLGSCGWSELFLQIDLQEKPGPFSVFNSPSDNKLMLNLSSPVVLDAVKQYTHSASNLSSHWRRYRFSSPREKLPRRPVDRPALGNPGWKRNTIPNCCWRCYSRLGLKKKWSFI